MKKKSFQLDIRVDEKTLKENYPNYKFNFSNTDEFIEFLIANILQEEGTEDYGFSITITPIHKKHIK
jgi:hypothetical protein